jgi:hypothetical protein
MKVRFRRRSAWQRIIDPLATKIKNKTTTFTRKGRTAQTVAKSARRATATVAIATVVSSFVSFLRERGSN